MSIGIGRKKNEIEILVFFLVFWENVEFSFEDFVVKKNNEEY